jgi:hypothetical protein
MACLSLSRKRLLASDRLHQNCPAIRFLWPTPLATDVAANHAIPGAAHRAVEDARISMRSVDAPGQPALIHDSTSPWPSPSLGEEGI